MRKIKNNSPFRIHAFILIFSILSITAYAQDQSGTYQGQSDSTLRQSGTNQNQTGTIQGQTGSSQNASFSRDAQRFANELVQQLGLSSDKAEKISKILTDYRSDIAEAREDYMGKNPGNHSNSQDNTKSNTAQNDNSMNSDSQNRSRDNNQDVTGGQSRQDRTAMAGSDIDSDPGLMSEYRKADEKADKDIIDALDNDAQKAKYIQIKSQWWKDVKNNVYSSVKQNSGSEQIPEQQTK